MKLQQKRVLVTGGAGFMGSEIVRQLCENGAAVSVLDNFSSGKKEYLPNMPNIKIIKGDVCDNHLVKQIIKGVELVIHVAALPFIPDSYHAPEDFIRVNITGTMNMLWESINSETVERFVHVSSSEVYGNAKYLPMDEKHPTIPHSTYAVTKLASARLVFTTHKEHGFPVTILRPFNAYGPNVTQPYIVPEIIVQLLRNNASISLGNIDSSRDFTYVSDTARGIILAAISDATVGETINLGSGKDIKIKDLAYLIASLMDRKIRIMQDNSRLRPYDVTRLVCDSSKAKQLLKWQPKVSLEDGLKIVINWLKTKPEIVRNWIPYTERHLVKVAY
jgi:nucleoside-diphosphate-sugar epimerase